MIKPLIFCVLTALTALPAAARVCVVYDFDTRGCKAGDELLYLPQMSFSEQRPIEFIAKKCDASKRVAWTSGGVTCTYVENKTVVEGHKELEKKAYAKIFNEACCSKNSNWIKMDAEEYWRIASRAQGAKPRVGDRVKVFERNCKHDADGTEHSDGQYLEAGVTEPLAKDNPLIRIGAPYGSEIEIIRPNDHGYIMVERLRGR